MRNKQREKLRADLQRVVWRSKANCRGRKKQTETAPPFWGSAGRDWIRFTSRKVLLECAAESAESAVGRGDASGVAHYGKETDEAEMGGERGVWKPDWGDRATVSAWKLPPSFAGSEGREWLQPFTLRKALPESQWNAQAVGRG
jgi:hypothetical protein